MASGQLPLINYAEYPLKDIPEPHAHDVLCGRGGGTNNHIGNSHWRMLVAANKQLYITLPKRQKMLLSRSIVNAVRSQNPPGRFLQKDGKTKLWFDVGDQRAQEKTSQALREGAPDIRKKVAAAKSTASTNSTGTSTTTPAVPISGSNSESGIKRDGGETSQIPAHSSAASSMAQQQEPESAVSSAVLSQRGSGDRIEPEHYNPQQQQQQLNNMYVSNNSQGNMSLNDRGVLIQNAMMNGVRGMNGQHHQINNNESNYQQSHSAYRFQQQNQQGRLQQQIHSQQDYQQQYQFLQQQQQQLQQQQHNNVINYQQRQQQYQLDHQQQYYDSNNNSMPTFDEFVAPPPEELDGQGYSFGSIAMSDAEMQKLQQVNAMSMSRHNGNRRHSLSNQDHTSKTSSNRNNNDSDNNPLPAAPMGGVLEPTGISIGDVSMMSGSTNFQMKLEDTGTSFGTMMSYNTLNNNSIGNNPDMVDGGLMDAVGTSFGSLSLDKNNRDMLFKTLEMAAGGPEVPPMFRSETKSSANLLDCSDTESESSRDKEQLTKQKSQAWEMMKTQLDKQTSKGASVGSQDLMPPPVGIPQNNVHKNANNNHSNLKSGSADATFDNLEIALPTTTMEANFSTLSAWSAADDDFNDTNPAIKREYADNSTGRNDNNDENQEDIVAIPPPPPQLTKTDSF